MSEPTANFDLENALTELEKLVEAMEGGKLSLENSLQIFERGMLLTKQCQAALQQAEQKIQILLANNGEHTLTDYTPTADE